ncbi:MAG: peroxiredoxin [Flavobacteriaceae bacterium]|nr:peroxiredoxin [Flavobacteriaceae bacterium]
MKLNDTLPKFTLTNQEGEEVSSVSWVGNSPVLIYFYPKDFTPGCTREACGFRDHYEDFSDKGIKVVGISSDSNTSHQKFAQKHQLSFTLLSDPDGKVRKLFHVKSTLLGILPGRETFLFDKEGKLTFKFRSISGDSHVKEALKHIS